MEENKTYRIRTKVGDDSDKVIHVKLDQHYDSFEILSLKIDQTNNYKTYESDYGVVIGRVLANGGFGIPNAKVSIFIESDGNDNLEDRILYPYKSPTSKNADGVRYNLLTDFLDKACYQNVGTFPNKRLVLDNDDVIDIFDKYYRYTTVTNNAGDYMIFGVPTGSQRMHIDIDLSDIGMLSQRPRDMIYKGYNINLFDSPNKFKRDTNLNSLSQIISQDIGLYVYPYWGDTTDDSDNIAVTRADINIDYKFEPTCVFMGSIVTDTGSNAIGKNCTSTERVGKMSELIAGEGSIEMIRKTIDGRVEEFQVKGNRVIDGDGVWCYQIPMNLDYIMTDEFGNIVPSDNPEKGIPTRTRVRFRISVDDAPSDNTARKRCRYLVPNNPRLDEELYPNFTKTKEVDYEFGTKTKNENYRDLLWNKVYTVKNYVPRLQKNRRVTDRKHTGIKLINHHETNNPMPYNNVDIKLGFTYRMMCIIFKIFINLVQFLNQILTALSLGFCAIYSIFDFIADKLCFKLPVIHVKPLCWMAWPFRQLAKLFWALIVPCVGLGSDMCGGNTTHNNTFFPGCGNLLFSGAGAGALANCIRQKTTEALIKKEDRAIANGEMDKSERTKPILGGTNELYNCVETALAEDNDTISLNFQNDWVNGTLYAPMWFRKITKKKSYLFGLIKRRAKDQWCEGEKDYTRKILRIFAPCSPKRNGKQVYTNFDGITGTTAYYMNFSDNKRYADSCRDRCHESTQAINLNKGLIVKRQTMLGQDVYYYKPVEYSSVLDIVSDESDDFAVSENSNGGSVKLLFATDIVLLGSLNDCDIHGVPQFFKSLESTTFQIPPNILFADNEIIVEIDKGSTSSGDNGDPDNVNVTYNITEQSVSEMTGMDWGNHNDDICGRWNDSQDSGLFYSIGCSTIEMKPKSCVNMTRICEYGVSLDETKSVLDTKISQSSITSDENPKDDAIYGTIVPDGFISKDELYNDDERSMFATLNVNGLWTKRNPENGLMEYEFKHVVVDNFDKSLYEYMSERQRSCDKTQKFNYLLEEFSSGYYDFRMGRIPYYYDKNHKLPRYENSFYFYFGLHPGKTAIDKFNSQFLSNCANDGEEISPVDIEAVANSWCADLNQEYDGYVAFDLSAVDLPCDIIIRRTDYVGGDGEFVISDNEDGLFYISGRNIDELDSMGYVRKTEPSELSNGLPNGVYEAIITDNNGEIISVSFNLRPKTLKTYIVPTDFYEPDNVLMKRFSQNRQSIASDDSCLESCGDLKLTSTRYIGGTIVILKPYDEDTSEILENYKIEVTADDMDGVSFIYNVNGNSVNQEEHTIKLLMDCDKFIVLGLPKGDEKYTITITQMCLSDGYYIPSGNIFMETVLILAKSPYKLFINGVVDYDVIKHWKSGYKAVVNPSSKTPSVTSEGSVSSKWWHMSNPQNYLWCFYQPYIDADKEICDSLKTYDVISNTTDDFGNFIINHSLLNSTYKARRDRITNPSTPHFMYDDVEVNDDSEIQESTTITEMDFSIIMGSIALEIEALTNEAEGIDDTDDELALKKNLYLYIIEIDENILEILNGVVSMKDEFINYTKMAFQLSCAHVQKSIFFSVNTKDQPVIYHGVYRPESMNDDGIYTIEEKHIYTNEGENIDTITVPTISHKESERFSSNEIIEGKICVACDNISTYRDKRKLANFIAVINGRGRTIPNDAEYSPEGDECGNDDYTDRTIIGKHFGYHIIDKIFENKFMMWSYFDRLPYYMPMSGDCINNDKAGTSICMNGIFASKIFNGNATSYRKVYVNQSQEDVDKYLSESEYNAIEDETTRGYYTKYYHEIGTSECDNGTNYITENKYDNELSDEERADYEVMYVRTSNLVPDRTINEEEYDDLADKSGYTPSYETIFEEQQFTPFNLNIYTGRNDGETDADVEDKMPTVRYVVGEKTSDRNESKERHFDNFRVTAHDEEFNSQLWNLYTQQYASVTQREIDLVLEDENMCQLVDRLDGRMKVVLKEESVNLCSTDNRNHRDGSKFAVKVENENGNDIRYFVFTTDENAEDGNWVHYPLNYAENYDDCSLQMLCRKSKYDMGWNDSTDETTALFGRGNEKNLFSYYSNPTYHDNNRYAKIGNAVVRRQLASKYIDDANEVEIDTEGYGNTGEFQMERYDRPYFVVAISDNNCRAISPVYDFSYVCARLIFGIVYIKRETTDEFGNVNGYEVIEVPKMTFDVANAIRRNCFTDSDSIEPDCIHKNEILYYFYYYPYRISFEIKLDDISAIKGEYVHEAFRNNPNGYELFTMDEHAYDRLYNIYRGSNNKVGRDIRNNTVIEARDYTGLRHIVDWRGCWQDHQALSYGCGNPYEYKKWVTITWVTNGGLWVKSGDPSKYVDAMCADEGNECAYYGTDTTITKTFAVGDVYNVCNVGNLEKEGCTDSSPECQSGGTDTCNSGSEGFIGWATSYDSQEVVTPSDITIQGNIEESMIYYAVWACDFVSVTWVNCNNNPIKHECMRVDTIIPVDEMVQSDDPSVTFIEWICDSNAEYIEGQGYLVKGDTVFTARCAASCKPSLRLINCADIGKDYISIVYMELEAFKNEQDAANGIRINEFPTDIVWGPERLGSPNNPSLTNEAIYQHERIYTEGNVIRFTIKGIELSNGCLIYPNDRCIEQIYSEGSCGDMFTDAFCDSIDVNLIDDIVIGRGCSGSRAKAVITQYGFDCSCTVMYTVVWEWGYDRNEDKLDNDVIKVDNYVCEHDTITHPQGISRDGYSFIGWKLLETDETYEGWETYDDVTSDLTFVAQWDNDMHVGKTIQFSVRNSMSDSQETLPLSLPTKSAVEFDVIKPNGGVDTFRKELTMPSTPGVVNGSLEILTVFETIQVKKVECYTSDTGWYSFGIGNNSGEYYYELYYGDENVTSPTRPYTFDDGDNNKDIKVVLKNDGDTTPPQSTVKVYFYNSLEDLNTGAHPLGVLDADSETNEIDVSLIPVASQEGKVFKCWAKRGESNEYTNEAFIGAKFTQETKFYAKYNVSRINVCFDFNLPEDVDGKDIYGNTVYPVIDCDEIDYGGIRTVPNKPSLYMWNFNGWKLGQDVLTDEQVNETMLEKDTTYVALWVKEQQQTATVTWNVEYETVNGTMSTTTYSTDEFSDLPHTLTNSDIPSLDSLKGATDEYDAFSGTGNQPTWSPYSPNNASISGDITFTATFMRNTFNVTFKLCNGTNFDYQANPVKYGNVVNNTLVPDPATEGCTLNQSNPWNPVLTTPVTSSMIFTANCDCEEQMINYKVDWELYNYSRFKINSISIYVKAVNVANSSLTRECETAIVAGGGIPEYDPNAVPPHTVYGFRSGNTIGIKGLGSGDFTYITANRARFNAYYDGNSGSTEISTTANEYGYVSSNTYNKQCIVIEGQQKPSSCDGNVFRIYIYDPSGPPSTLNSSSPEITDGGEETE